MDTTEIEEDSKVTAGRRLRTRPSKVELSNEETFTHRGQSRQKKRKAEVNIESLYLQETNREVRPTPLETIFEAPQYARKNGRRKGSTGDQPIIEEEDTRQMGSKNVDELGMSTLMGGRKIKRLCLFTSHYYPSKQKERLRKDRARKMKQLRGVKIPKGTGITVQDVQEVLSKLSDDESEQNENNQNRSNCRRVSLNSSVSFYVGNVVRPDTGDESLHNMIENLEALQVKHSGESSTIENNIPPLPFELDIPLPFTDPALESRPSSKSRENRSRRRSGRVSGCLLNSVTRQATEGSTSPQISELLPKPLASELADPKLLQGSTIDTVSSQWKETSVSSKPLASLGEEEVEEQVTTIRHGTKRRKTMKNPVKSTKNGGLLKRVSELEDSELVKKMKENTSYNNINDKPCLLSDVTDVTDKDIEFGHDKFNLPSPSDIKPKSRRGRGGARRQRGRRRVSGIQRSLYRHQIEVSESESSSPDSFLKNSRTETVDQIVKPDLSEHLKASPISPSSQMAALSLHTDLPFTSCGQDTESQAENKRTKNARKARRRSSRLVIGTSPSRTINQSSSALGSYWDSSSPYQLPKLLNPPVLSVSHVTEDLQGSDNILISEPIPHFIETSEIKLTKDTENGNKNSPRKLSPLLEMVSTHKTDEKQSELVEMDNSSIVIPGFTQNMSGNTSSITKSPSMIETNHIGTVQLNKTVVETDPEMSCRQDNRTPRRNEGCIWDVFKQHPKHNANKKSPKMVYQVVDNSSIPSPCTSTDNHVKVEIDNINGDQENSLGNAFEMEKEKDESVVSDSNPLNMTRAKISSPIEFGNRDKLHVKTDWDSPVLCGMFEGKAGIRLGKVFCNKETFAASPITLSQLCQPSKDLIPVTPSAQHKSPQQIDSPGPICVEQNDIS